MHRTHPTLPALGACTPAGPLFVDEPGGTVVRHPEASRLRIADFPSKERLAERLMAFIQRVE